MARTRALLLDHLRVLLLEYLLERLRDEVVLGAVCVVRHAVRPHERHVVLELLRRRVLAAVKLGLAWGVGEG